MKTDISGRLIGYDKKVREIFEDPESITEEDLEVLFKSTIHNRTLPSRRNVKRAVKARIKKHVAHAAKLANITFDNAIKNAMAVLEAFAEGKSHSAMCFLMADLQSGKTASLILVIMSMPALWPNKNIGVMFVTNKALRDIIEQTVDRMKAIGFKGRNACGQELLVHPKLPHIFVATSLLSSNSFNSIENTGRFKEMKDALESMGCENILWAFDEMHVGVKPRQMFHRFFESMGYSVPASPQDNFIPDTLFFGITATAHKQFIHPVPDFRPYVIYGRPGENYYGLEDAMKSGRLVYPPGVDKKNLPKHKIVLSEKQWFDLLDTENRRHKNKFFVIRIPARPAERDDLMRVIKRLKLKSIEYSAAARNLSRINNEFAWAPTENTVILIKNGLGAGITIDTIEHIGAWVETAYNDLEALVQAIGRICGYTEDRHRASFKMYCYVDKVRRYLKARDTLAEGKDEINLFDVNEYAGRRLKKKVRYGWRPVKPFSFRALTADQLDAGVVDAYSKDNGDWRRHLLNMSQNAEQNYAERTLEEKNFGNINDRHRILKVDGPPPTHSLKTGERVKDYEKRLAQFNAMVKMMKIGDWKKKAAAGNPYYIVATNLEYGVIGMKGATTRAIFNGNFFDYIEPAQEAA